MRKAIVACLAMVLGGAVPAVAQGTDGTDGGPGPVAARKLTAVWLTEGEPASAPVHAGGAIYYLDDGRVLRRDAATGRELTFPALPADLPPLTDGSRIFTTRGYAVSASALDGRPLWTRRPGRTRAVTTAGGLLVAAGRVGGNTELRAWSAGTGAPQWTSRVGGGTPSLVAGGDFLAVLTTPRAGEAADVAATVTVLDAATGATRWSREGLPAGPLAADGDTVYVAAGRLWALDAADGTSRWTTGSWGYASVTAGPEGVFATEEFDRVVAIGGNGEQRWAVEGAVLSRPTVSNGVVWFRTHDPDERATQLVALRATSGRTLRRLEIPGFSGGDVSVGGGRVFLTLDEQGVLGLA